MGLKILVCAAASWLVAGVVKLSLVRIFSKKWDWRLIFSTGGMPSSHSAFVSGIAMAVGLYAGFDTAVFAVAVALAMIVVADAAGVRRQAGMHAQRINLILNDLFQGRTLTEKQLKEMLGHTPFEVAAGVTTGVVSTFLIWLIWK